MYVYLSAAISADGYLDDRSAQRLILSNPDDLDAVKRLRAEFDAILVGAGTVRKDNPALVIRDQALRTAREKAGMRPDIIKVTVTSSGDIDTKSRFFTEGKGTKVVIAGQNLPQAKYQELLKVAEVRLVRNNIITPKEIVGILSEFNITSLFVEGGGEVLTSFLDSDVPDYFRLAVAPFFLGDEGGVKIVSRDVKFTKSHRMNLVKAYPVGDMAVTEYLLNNDINDYYRLQLAIMESKKCPPSETAYSVGAIIVTDKGGVFTGYSRETGGSNHAEEEAIAKALDAGVSLKDATIYSSMEPCSSRSSKPKSCSELIIGHEMKKVVFAAKEPSCFVDCVGEERLRNSGLQVIYMRSLEKEALEPNKHIFK